MHSLRGNGSRGVVKDQTDGLVAEGGISKHDEGNGQPPPWHLTWAQGPRRGATRKCAAPLPGAGRAERRGEMLFKTHALLKHVCPSPFLDGVLQVQVYLGRWEGGSEPAAQPPYAPSARRV
jgi:hypothetical protein